METKQKNLRFKVSTLDNIEVLAQMLPRNVDAVSVRGRAKVTSIIDWLVTEKLNELCDSNGLDRVQQQLINEAGERNVE